MYAPLAEPTLRWVRTDGGRAAAGFQGFTGDCVVRAITIATGHPYRLVHDRLSEALGRHLTPRGGVPRHVYEPVLAEWGWTWRPAMGIGTGCVHHLRRDEIPMDATIIARLTHHITCVRDGVIHDLFDPSRAGTRCVYGWFHQ